jgi:hypothetical protein
MREFADTIRAAADSIDRLAPDTRGRIVDHLARRSGTVGDLMHDYRRTLDDLRKAMK